MLRTLGSVFFALMFLGSMAGAPLLSSAHAASQCQCKGDGKGCQCGEGCKCEHRTGKAAAQGCQCGPGCTCEHCKTGKGTCPCRAGGRGCGCKAGGDGCRCGKGCRCEHCKTGKGDCSCKGGGKEGCKCGADCKCAHCAADAAHAHAQKPATDADYAATRTSKEGAFRASYVSAPEAIPVNKMINWTLKVETGDGQPVKDAEIALVGDMPEHGHGLPTQPKVTKNFGDGTYLVEGMKFSMPGWWTLTFTITAGGKTDTVTFNLQLK